MIGLIDYEAGNLASVSNALRRIRVEAKVIKTPEDFGEVSGIILPGVGSADATMKSLEKRELLRPLEEKVLGEKIPFLGICVGLQILFEDSEEGGCRCLGWIKGNVRRFSGGVRVPQIGWNQVEFLRPDPILDRVESGNYFYFVNSFYAVPKEDGVQLGTTVYGRPFCSMVRKDNLYAAQFHLEKSGEIGLQLLENFARVDPGRRS
ncbi:MAG: imidazole glycerol phosphate synthase subunit HisH [Clostridium sp.]|jgi:glutamine amidotransferase|nr:imidazole glycerol phosphate synthase subunit HisH [Clostridium sp.]